MTYVGGHRALLGTGRTQESIEELEIIVLTWRWPDKDIFIHLNRSMHNMIRLRDQMGACGRAKTSTSCFHIFTEKQYDGVHGAQYLWHMPPLEGCTTQDQIGRPSWMDLDVNRTCSRCTACPDVVAHGLLGTEPASQCISAGNIFAEGGRKEFGLRIWEPLVRCDVAWFCTSVTAMFRHWYPCGEETELDVCFPEACPVQTALPHRSWQTPVQHMSVVLWESQTDLPITCGGQLFPCAELY